MDTKPKHEKKYCRRFLNNAVRKYLSFQSEHINNIINEIKENKIKHAVKKVYQISQSIFAWNTAFSSLALLASLLVKINAIIVIIKPNPLKHAVYEKPI